MTRHKRRHPIPGHPRWVGYYEVVRIPCSGYSARYERRVRIGRFRVWIWRACRSMSARHPARTGNACPRHERPVPPVGERNGRRPLVG